MERRPMVRMRERGGVLVDRVCARLAPTVADATVGWRGSDGPDDAAAGVLTFADCSFRAMELHGRHNPPGYPQALVERLAERGVALRGRTVFTPRADDLPATPDDLRRWYDLPGEPDLVVVQTGAMSAMRTVLGLRPSVQDVRDRVSRALGTRKPAVDRVLWPRFLPLTRTTLPEQDPEALGRFARLVREVWPGTALVALPPFVATPHACWSHADLRATADGIRRLCEREGIEFVDPNPAIEALGIEQARCTNGYNVTMAGHRLVAEALEPHLVGALSRRSAASL
jgi:hypothetical protein